MTNQISVPKFDLKKTISENRMKGLWRLLTGFRLHYTAATFSLGIAALARTGIYLLLRYFVDDVLGQSNAGVLSTQAIRQLPLIALGFLGLAFIMGSFTFISGKLAAYTSEGITVRLRNYLLDHIQRLSFAYHDQSRTGDLVQRSTSDVDAIRRFFADQAIGIGRLTLLFTVNFIALLNLNTKLALVSVIAVPLIIITSIYFFRKVSKLYEQYQKQDSVLSSTLQENLSGVRVVKAFARQSYEREKFDLENIEKYKRGRHLLIMHSAFWPLSDILCGFQMLGGFAIGAVMAINGTITVGTYLAYAGLIIWLIWPMRHLGRLIVQTSTGLVSFGRILEIIKQEQEPLSAGSSISSSELRGEIIFSNVGFGYAQNEIILHDITFQCKPGQSIALLGSTGSGKTSLVNLLPRFYEYTSGKLTLDGYELKKLSRNFLRQIIGIVEQEPFLFSRTIRENIIYGVSHEISQEEVIEAAKAAAIHEVILTFPKGYDTLVGEKGVTLSGGQKQRIAIARTLLKNPRILILDDATSSVDPETEVAIRSALKNLMTDRTSFIIAHRVQSVMNADVILVLDKGRIVQQGIHDDLITKDGIYRQIFEMQTHIEKEIEKEINLS